MSHEGILVVSSKQELLAFGYSVSNIHKEVIYEGTSFTLIKPGFKKVVSIPFTPLSPFAKSYELKPTWSFTVGDAVCRINHIE
jgi:hypothetical protein